MWFKFLSFILAWTFPTKEDRKTFRDFCQKFVTQDNCLKTQKHYKKVLKRIQKKRNNGKKIKVVFIVSENQKWGYQTLYELFEKSDVFEPLVLISLLIGVHKGLDKTRINSQENYDFFKSRNMNVEYLYENNQYKKLKSFEPDIVFYEQQWGLPDVYKPKNVSKYALTCFCSYGYETLDISGNYLNDFHGFLFKYFIEHQLNFDRYKKYSPIAEKNCLVTGYPKLDDYIKYSKKSQEEKMRIIYAPHHSFDNSLKLATFEKNANYILDLAKKHPETIWIFKPHPRLKYALLINDIMTEEEVNDYYSQWEKIGKIHTQGNYIEDFVNSDLMITDCLSFLAEYLPSKNPLIRLINDKSMHLNSLGDIIVSEYYNVHSNSELDAIFNEIIINKNDYKRENRLKLINTVFDSEIPASLKIYEYLLNILN